jgi:hypothetical protein
VDYYKILNEKEKHHNFQYKYGLNIDIVPFNPYGSCRPGGIYFSREDILAFLHYGPWIRKVIIPEDARVYENPGEPRKWKADRVILGKKEKITVKVIRRLIKEGADPKSDNACALSWAAQNGHLEIIKLLIKKGVNPKARNSYALQLAARHDQIEVVKLLLPLSNPKADISLALRLALQYRHFEICKLLIPVSGFDEIHTKKAIEMWGSKELLDLFNHYKRKKRVNYNNCAENYIISTFYKT